MITVDSKMKKIELKMKEFLEMDLSNRLILDIQVPPLASNNLIRTYKVRYLVTKALKIHLFKNTLVIQLHVT